MNFKNSNQIPIFDEFANLYGEIVDTHYSQIQAIAIDVSTSNTISTTSSGDSPFLVNGNSNNYEIVFAIQCCNDYKFTNEEKFALIAHELGHIIIELNNQSSHDLQEELQADKIASKIVDKNNLKNALQKIADLIDTNNDWSELDYVSKTKDIKKNLIIRIELLQ